MVAHLASPVSSVADTEPPSSARSPLSDAQVKPAQAAAAAQAQEVAPVTAGELEPKTSDRKTSADCHALPRAVPRLPASLVRGASIGRDESVFYKRKTHGNSSAYLETNECLRRYAGPAAP